MISISKYIGIKDKIKAGAAKSFIFKILRHLLYFV